jgi:hypothetical protein
MACVNGVNDSLVQLLHSACCSRLELPALQHSLQCHCLGDVPCCSGMHKNAHEVPSKNTSHVVCTSLPYSCQKPQIKLS